MSNSDIRFRHYNINNNYQELSGKKLRIKDYERLYLKEYKIK